jgi:hypothetical protein
MSASFRTERSEIDPAGRTSSQPSQLSTVSTGSDNRLGRATAVGSLIGGGEAVSNFGSTTLRVSAILPAEAHFRGGPALIGIIPLGRHSDHRLTAEDLLD